MRRQRLSLVLMVIIAFVAFNVVFGIVGCSNDDDPGPAPTGTRTPRPTGTRSPSPTMTQSPSPTPTQSPSPTPTQSQTPTPSPSPTTIVYPTVDLSAQDPNPDPTPDVVVFEDVFDLTAGDLTLSFNVDTNDLLQPYGGDDTPYVLVGLMNSNNEDMPPGEPDTYQGSAGGWIEISLGSDIDSTQSESTIDDVDKFILSASEGRDEYDYDVDNGVIQEEPLGQTYPNLEFWGIWFDRDGIDAADQGMWGYEQEMSGKSYFTQGLYQVEIDFVAVDNNLGYMMATINGIPQGIWTEGRPNDTDEPDMTPVGLSFKADMKNLVVFAALLADDSSYGSVTITNLTVNGVINQNPNPTPTPTSTGDDSSSSSSSGGSSSSDSSSSSSGGSSSSDSSSSSSGGSSDSSSSSGGM